MLPLVPNCRQIWPYDYQLQTGLSCSETTTDIYATALDMAGIEKALKSSMVDTSVGKIKFDAKGDAVGVGFSVYQVQGGKFVEQK